MKNNSGDNSQKKPSNASGLCAIPGPAALGVAGPGVEWAAMPERRSGPRASAGPDFQEEVKRVLLGRYTPAAVLVDDSLNVVYVHGHVGRYFTLSAGAPTANLIKMTNGDLGIAIRAAILKVKSEDRPVSKSVRCAADGRPAGITLDVMTVRSSSDRRRGYLILFKGDAASGAAATHASAGQLEFDDRRGAQAGRAAGGGAPKKTTDVNDELEAAKEELQAANAELVAVNMELRKGNSDLNATNDDLSNLLASSQIPILMLDRKMRIRRLTPPAESASLCTVLTTQYSVVPSLPSMRRAPVDHLAMGLEISKEKIEPANPTTSEKPSSTG